MKKSFYILLFLLFSTLIFAQTEDLFFSEYLEGSSNNKALEIFNGTGAEIDLSNYIVKSTYNGNDWGTDYYSFPAGATLADGDVWVVANEGATQAILDQADDILAYNAGGYVVSFNGNDARGLFKINGKDEVLLDVIGVPGIDPGDGWDVAGVSAATKDHTLVRKSSVSAGDTDWETSAGTDEGNSEWTVYPSDTIDYLGFHTYDGGEDLIPPTLMNAQAISVTNVKVTFSEPVSQETAENISNYSIAGLTISEAVLSPSTIVNLTTSEQTAGENYTLVVNNIADLADNIIAANASYNFTGYQGTIYTPIADIQNNFDTYNGTEVTVSGIVTIGDGLLHPGKAQFYIEDESGRGIQIYNSSPLAQTYHRGDNIEVTGTVGLYEGTSGKYHDVQIENPTVTLLSEGENLPAAHILAGNEDLIMNGTWSKVSGTISDIWDAADYGFYKITVDLDNGPTTDLMFWNSAVSPDSISNYIIGDQISGLGVITFYDGTPQLTCGYAEDISYYTGGESEYISFQPELPQDGDSVTVSFTVPDTLQNRVKYVFLRWKTSRDADYRAEEMQQDYYDEIKYEGFIPPQSQGITVYFYVSVTDTSNNIMNFMSDSDTPLLYSIPVADFKAILNIPAKPFNPFIGETFLIEFGAKYGDKAILRIYNVEGKLVSTPQNLIVTNPDGLVQYEWDGRDRNHKLLSIGLYYCYLEVIDPENGNKKIAKAPIVIGAPLK